MEEFSMFGVSVFMNSDATEVLCKKGDYPLWMMNGSNLRSYYDNTCDYIRRNKGLCPLEDINNVVYKRG